MYMLSAYFLGGFRVPLMGFSLTSITSREGSCGSRSMGRKPPADWRTVVHVEGGKL